MSDAHGRDHVTTAELALDRDGKILGAAGSHASPIWAPICRPSPRSASTYLYATLLSGQYDIPAIYAESRACYTNTAPVDAYRGAGRPEATYVVERLWRRPARARDRPGELRRRNFIKPDAFPYQTPVAHVLRRGDYDAVARRGAGARGLQGFPERRAAAEKAGKLRGIGLRPTSRPAASRPPTPSARSARASACGRRPRSASTRSARSRSHRQPRRTARATRRRSPSSWRKSSASTSTTSSSSRATPARCSSAWAPTARAPVAVGIGDLKGLDKVDREGQEGRRPSAGSLPGDIDVRATAIHRQGHRQEEVDRRGRWRPMCPQVPDSRRSSPASEGAFYDPVNFTFPFGCHICEVEVDPETGVTTIVNWVAVDDFGTIINPMIVEGQVHGGIAQGVGQALLENAAYDPESGQLAHRLLHGLHHAARRRPAELHPRLHRDPCPSTRWASRAAARPAPLPPRRR
jgi:aerobic carbon-monoxide dehydrogenase large subunit